MCVFLLLKASTQIGPNIFWTLAALQYVKTTSDFGWLDEWFDHIDKVGADRSLTFRVKILVGFCCNCCNVIMEPPSRACSSCRLSNT
jgi:hypothetical protein